MEETPEFQGELDYPSRTYYQQENTMGDVTRYLDGSGWHGKHAVVTRSAPKPILDEHYSDPLQQKLFLKRSRTGPICPIGVIRRHQMVNTQSTSLLSICKVLKKILYITQNTFEFQMATPAEKWIRRYSLQEQTEGLRGRNSEASKYLPT